MQAEFGLSWLRKRNPKLFLAIQAVKAMIRVGQTNSRRHQVHLNLLPNIRLWMLEHMTPFGPQVRNQMTQTNVEFIDHRT
jgi:hypothetical protein